MDIQEYDLPRYLGTLGALITEYNTSDKEKLENVMIHLPRSWYGSKEIVIDSVPYDFTTDSTLEIEVNWKDKITNTIVNYTPLSMKAPS